MPDMLRLGNNANYRDTDYPNSEVSTVYLSDAARRQGTYIVGTTGTGKTTLLLSMIYQDIQRGDGLCVLDPHGDFTMAILSRIPRKRWDDVILFDPSDIDYPFGLNLLHRDRDGVRERDLVVSTVIDTLYKLFADSWGPRMEDLLRHGILSLLLHPEPTTLIHLMMLMVNYQKRRELTAKARELDSVLRLYWENEFPENTFDRVGQFKRPREQIELVSSSLNKIGRFITNPTVRHIVGQPETTFNLREIMDKGQILLVNLSKGELGQDNASLLGAVLVNQILIAALSRSERPEEERRLFHLYVDEYQNFATRAFPQLQSEARKYGIDTVVAHQFRDQLDEEHRGSTLNVANLICLRVSGKDGFEIAGQLDLTPPVEPYFEPVMIQIDEYGRLFAQSETYGGTRMSYGGLRHSKSFSDMQQWFANILAQLPNYQAICRVLEPHKEHPRRLYQFRINLVEPPGVDEAYAREAIAYIRERSRRLCKFDREGIAAYIAAYTQSGTSGSSAIPIMDTR